MDAEASQGFVGPQRLDARRCVSVVHVACPPTDRGARDLPFSFPRRKELGTFPSSRYIKDSVDSSTDSHGPWLSRTLFDRPWPFHLFQAIFNTNGILNQRPVVGLRTVAQPEAPVLARAPRVQRALARHGRRVREPTRHLPRQRLAFPNLEHIYGTFPAYPPIRTWDTVPNALARVSVGFSQRYRSS